MKVPCIKTALEILNWAGNLNPGSWVEHSKNVGRAAKAIAEKCDLNPEIAYCMGLLHDIGRYEGISYLKHTISGYKLMTKQGYDDMAKICLTHSFPLPNINQFSGYNDCNERETEFIINYLQSLEYNDYDKLIQLCDALGDANGITLIELRLMDVARRHGITPFTAEKWDAFFNLKDYFSNKIGFSVYSLFIEEIQQSILSM